MWINKSKCQPHMKLDIGAGKDNQLEGYVLNDIQRYEKIDLICNIRDLQVFIPNGWCSEVRASHVLEHFGLKDVIGVIKMIHELLEEHGKFTVIVPNFHWHAELVLSGNDEMGVYYAFGGQNDEFDYHKTAFTTKILRKSLEASGFKVLDMGDDTSIVCHAEKI